MCGAYIRKNGLSVVTADLERTPGSRSLRPMAPPPKFLVPRRWTATIGSSAGAVGTESNRFPPAALGYVHRWALAWRVLPAGRHDGWASRGDPLGWRVHWCQFFGCHEHWFRKIPSMVASRSLEPSCRDDAVTTKSEGMRAVLSIG